jgi:hypothetical protein
VKTSQTRKEKKTETTTHAAYPSTTTAIASRLRRYAFGIIPLPKRYVTWFAQRSAMAIIAGSVRQYALKWIREEGKNGRRNIGR